eukprot:TRINITY_DN8000_c1_g2_i1.p2 TRINITY_DN8000_c1_g2~~TRINITY_DN8000_c1_g2_i1.p2  ORF type:complete len:238 (+),score=46.59 TRINITY_DN8000_c1_g2_i1:1524-2237(+)
MESSKLELPDRLKEYFRETSIEVLRSFSQDDLMSIVDKVDRPALLLFLKAGGFAKYEPPSKESKVSMVNLNGAVTSNQFAKLSTLTLSKVLATIGETKKREAQVLDLRGCNLLDVDIATLVEELVGPLWPNLTAVLLEFNRIKAATDAIFKLLSSKPIMHVSLFGNPIATIDGTEVFFAKLSLDQAERAIVAAEYHLQHFGWQRLYKLNEDVIATEGALENIAAAHKAFYQDQNAWF